MTRQTEMPVWVEVQGRVERDFYTGGWKLVAHKPTGDDFHIHLPAEVVEPIKRLFGEGE